MKGRCVVCAFCALAIGCSKNDDPGAPAPAASALAVSRTDAATTWHFVVDPKGSTHIEMPGLQENIRGETTAASGTLDVVPGDLASSRGMIRVDLSTFATRTFGTEKDETQTKHARTWLEVVVDGKTNDEMRWADFAIRSIDALSASDLAKVPPAREGSDDVRRVTMTVHGELLLHGHKVQKEATVEAAFQYPGGAGLNAKPLHVELKSKQPMRVVLKEHDVRPRDPAGKIAAWSTSLVAKVAETADVTVDLTATPSP
jgi:hypothetical protein